MAISVRDASKGDVPRLHAIFQRASLSNAGDRVALLANQKALVFDESSFLAGRVRVATVDSELVVGFVTTYANNGSLELIDLFTDPNWMRKGVATRLLDDVIEYAASEGVGEVAVVGNPHSLGFYTKYGFSEVGLVATEFGRGHRLNLVLARGPGAGDGRRGHPSPVSRTRSDVQKMGEVPS